MSLLRAHLRFLLAIAAASSLLAPAGAARPSTEILPSRLQAPGPALFFSLGGIQGPPSTAQENPPAPDTRILRKQRRELLKTNLDKMKSDAEQMADLVKSLQEDLGKANQNVLSLTVVQKAEKIEKLARKIKETARGY